MTDTTSDQAGLPKGLVMAARVVLLAGIAAFAVGAWSAHAQAAWTVLLANFLFWTGLAQAGVVWVAVLDVTGARWRAPVCTVASACAGFLPISFIPLILLAIGHQWIFPWIGHVGDRAAWLNVPALFARNAVGLALLTALSLIYVRRREEPGRKEFALPAVILVVYAVVYSIIAFDFVMSLHAFWVSTLIGPYFFCGAMFAALALIVVLAGPLKQTTLERAQWLDIGNLLLAFGMLTGYMLFAQIMVIWYGNLPEETGFLLERYNSPAWRWVMWSVVIGAFLLPFAAMVIREVKTNPKVLACVAFLVLVAMMVERYLLVGPSLMPGPPHLGPVEIFTTLGFAGAFAIALDWAFRWPSHREGE